MAPVEARRAEPDSRRGFSPLLGFGILLLAALLIVGGWLGWRFWGANLLAARSAADTVAQLRADWAANPAPAPEEGQTTAVDTPDAHAAAWILTIPALGLEWPVVAGVEPSDLAVGVGWYPGTALPGQVGNFVLAGPRITDGRPFYDLLDLAEGDEIVVETRGARFTYSVVLSPADLTVDAGADWVLDPVPGQPDEVPSQALITLTTSEDLVDTPDRAVGIGTLTETETP